MRIDVNRRSLIAWSAAAAVCGVSARAAEESNAALAALQARAGGRLGVFALDVGSGRSIGLNADARFGMCSTFKFPLAALTLSEGDAGRLDLAKQVPLRPQDILSYAPAATRALAAGRTSISLLECAEAAQVESDNTTANILIAQLGGPAGVTAGWRAMGDDVTRIDRLEPEMNLVGPTDVRDTTTPRAMAGFTARLARGELLQSASRSLLFGWMKATKTGLARLRAGLPPEWPAGDKTGTGQFDSMPDKINDVAIAWPPGRAPIVMAAYYEAPGSFDKIRAEDQAVLAEVGRITAAAMG